MESGGRIVGNVLESNVFPEPGGPVIAILCPPAATISRARLTYSWPLTKAISRFSSKESKESGFNDSDFIKGEID